MLFVDILRVYSGHNYQQRRRMDPNMDSHALHVAVSLPGHRAEMDGNLIER